MEVSPQSCTNDINESRARSARGVGRVARHDEEVRHLIRRVQVELRLRPVDVELQEWQARAVRRTTRVEHDRLERRPRDEEVDEGDYEEW